jgi:putative nucleotidyltransferase with HDIG domain
VFHLARRFIGYIASEPPTGGEIVHVRSQLDPELFELFIMMNAQDQRHAIDVAGRIDDAALVEAALLHDVGKSVTHVGAVGRSCATIAGALSIPVTGSWEMYLDHGEIGAAMLERAGASPVAVAFARFHPGPPPDGIPPEQWHALEAADDL